MSKVLLRPYAFGTSYGFYWYPDDSEAIIRVERTATINGVALLSVKSVLPDKDNEGPKLEVAVSKKGRSIRMWLNGKRMVPKEDNDE